MSAVDLLRRLVRVRNERGEWTSDRFRLMARRRMRKMVGDEPGRILDAGGGAGLLFDPAVWNGAGRVVILDLERVELGTAKRMYNGAGGFVCGDITRMPFRDGAFDAAVCVGTFYNFPGAEEVAAGIRELARVTRRGGSIFTEYRNAANPLVRMLIRNVASYDRTLGGLPLKPYRVDEIVRFHHAAGLEPVAIATVGPPSRKFCMGFIVHAKRIVNAKK